MFPEWSLQLKRSLIFWGIFPKSLTLSASRSSSLVVSVFLQIPQPCRHHCSLIPHQKPDASHTGDGTSTLPCCPMLPNVTCGWNLWMSLSPCSARPGSMMSTKMAARCKHSKSGRPFAFLAFWERGTKEVCTVFRNRIANFRPMVVWIAFMISYFQQFHFSNTFCFFSKCCRWNVHTFLQNFFGWK